MFSLLLISKLSAQKPNVSFVSINNEVRTPDVSEVHPEGNTLLAVIIDPLPDLSAYNLVTAVIRFPQKTIGGHMSV